MRIFLLLNLLHDEALIPLYFNGVISAYVGPGIFGLSLLYLLYKSSRICGVIKNGNLPV
jgi:hypothetical protein